MKPMKKWTTKEVELIRTKLAESPRGWQSEVAESLKRSRHSVWCMTRRIKGTVNPNKKWTEQERELVISLREEGKKYKEIGERLGVSAASARHVYLLLCGD